jgi:hypothetical protein
MLMHSPQHAFILHPGFEFIKNSWQDRGFTYTWVRDECLLPRKEFYDKMLLSASQQEHLLKIFSQKIPDPFSGPLTAPFLDIQSEVSIQEFRKLVLKQLFTTFPTLDNEKRGILEDQLDAFLYEHLPLIPKEDFRQVMQEMLSDCDQEALKKVLDQFTNSPSLWIDARMLRESAKACFLLATKKVQTPFDIHVYIARRASAIGVAPPPAILFADTNWSNFYFGFVVNPGTGQLDLWRLNWTGTKGVPMSAWRKDLDGTSRKAWSIYTRPFEYEAPIFNPQSIRL